MKIRLAVATDAKSVAAIIKRHAQTDYMGYATFNESYIKDKMKKNNFFFVAVIRDAGASGTSERTVGCLRASIVDLDLAEIRTLCVDEDCRDRGIATKLLETALDFLKKKKMRKIVARSKSDNTTAIKLFEKTGFEQEGHFREHYRKGIDIVQMAKFVRL